MILSTFRYGCLERSLDLEDDCRDTEALTTSYRKRCTACTSPLIVKLPNGSLIALSILLGRLFQWLSLNIKTVYYEDRLLDLSILLKRLYLLLEWSKKNDRHHGRWSIWSLALCGSSTLNGCGGAQSSTTVLYSVKWAGVLLPRNQNTEPVKPFPASALTLLLLSGDPTRIEGRGL